MDDFGIHMDYCKKCIDDHEERIRAIEKNNKLELRVEILEKYMTGQITTRTYKKDFNAILLAIIALLLSGIGIYLALS